MSTGEGPILAGVVHAVEGEQGMYDQDFPTIPPRVMVAAMASFGFIAAAGFAATYGPL